MNCNSVDAHAMDRADPLILVAEITHRVANEYSQAIAGLRLAATTATSNEARAVLSNAAARLLIFSAAHRALQAPRTGEVINLAEHLEKVVQSMGAACLLERGVKLTLSSDPVTLTAERCWRVALIVSELITNGARHGLKGGPGNILVEVFSNRSNVCCRVTDDGCGSSSPNPGRGFSIVAGLAFELKGTVGWQFSNDGTIAELKFTLTTEDSEHDPPSL